MNQKTIGKIVSNSHIFGDVLVIDDASIDKTSNIAELNGANLLINHTNLGYEASLMLGFKYAIDKNYKYLITIDADGQHDTNDIGILLDHLKNGLDIVTTKRNKLPRFSEKVFSKVGSLIWGIPDPLSGMKAYNLKNINKDNMNIPNYAGARIAIKIKQDGGLHSFINIVVADREDSSRYGGSILANIKILKALITLLLIRN